MAYFSQIERLRDARANVAAVTALSTVSLLISMAFAVDGASQLNTKRHMQAALDAASLRGAKELSTGLASNDEIVEDVEATFIAIMSSARGDLDCDDISTAIDDEAGEVGVEAECAFPAMLGGSLTPESITVTNSAIAQSVRTRIDVSMVLDVSGSMYGSKLDALKTAAKEAARMLLTTEDPGAIRVSAVNYATGVNAGKYGRYAWGEAIDLNDPNNYWVPGCVSERVGDAAWDDSAPEPGKWVTQAYYCPGSRILPLTSDLQEFEDSIDTLRANGSTAGHLGVAWAWYLISPLWSDVWPDAAEPLPYNQANTVKAVILMTDGIFNQSYHLAYGDSGTQATRLCTEMREAGIIIYSVAFQAPSSGQDTLRACAGDASRFYEASTEQELLDAYEDIASLLRVVRLTD